jgi:hypothetical protein
MHSKSIGRALLLAALAALVTGAGAARAQLIPPGVGEPTIGEPQVYGEDYAPPDPIWPLPLYHTHPENGGLYVAGGFVSYFFTNPMHSQVVAVRGLQIVDNSTVFPGQTRPFPVPTFLGSGTPALDVSEVRGPNDFQPGFFSEVGWKFADGTAFSVHFMYLTERNLHNDATFAAPGNLVRQDFADSFLFSPVSNFPNEFNGPANKLATDTGGSSSAPGIWNGASIETEQFLQRFQQLDAFYRTPIYETENYRISGLVGPRFTWIWERYKWVVTDLDVNGASAPNFVADYTNIVSNRMYGLNFGCQQECYIGHGFALDCTVNGTIYADSVKTEVKYSLARGANGEADPGPVSKRSRQQWEFSPEVQAKVGVMWYPIEGVQIHAGWDFQLIFNTISSPQPIDFRFNSVDPRFTTDMARYLDGLDIGIAFIF